MEGKSTGEGRTQRSTLFSDVQICSQCGKRARGNSYLCTVKNTRLRLITPPSLSLHFNPNQKINISPSIILHPNYIPPATPFYWLMLAGPLYVVTLQRKQSYRMLWTSRANLIQASSLLRLHTMFTTALLIESRQEKKKRTHPSLCAPQALNDREEMSHYGCLTLDFLSRSCTMPWPNLSSAERNGDKASF